MSSQNERIFIIETCGMIEAVIKELNEAYNLSSQVCVQEIIGEQLEMLESVKGRLLV